MDSDFPRTCRTGRQPGCTCPHSGEPEQVAPVPIPEATTTCARQRLPVPAPIDVQQIVAAGGKFVQAGDGRIIEYYVYGSERPDAQSRPSSYQ